MNRPTLLFSLALLPMLAFGTSSCSSLKTAQARFHDWQEKREERRQNQELARAEKEAGLPAAKLADAQDAPIFLDYNNPDAGVASVTRAAGDRPTGYSVAALPMLDLPMPSEQTNSVAATTVPDPALLAASDTPVFYGDLMPPGKSASELAAAKIPDFVKAWASSLPTMTGTSQTGPLITAAMTATPNAALAAAFAGHETAKPVSQSSLTSEHEHLSPAVTGPVFGN